MMLIFDKKNNFLCCGFSSNFILNYLNFHDKGLSNIGVFHPISLNNKCKKFTEQVLYLFFLPWGLLKSVLIQERDFLNRKFYNTMTQLSSQFNNFMFFSLLLDLGAPFFPGGPELWHHPLAYSAAAELPGSAALQHATLVHPALHPQMPVRSYL
jgi:hypothetical protein